MTLPRRHGPRLPLRRVAPDPPDGREWVAWVLIALAVVVALVWAALS